MTRKQVSIKPRRKTAKVYDYPRYYEIAFSFRDIPKEVSLFEECIRRYSRIPVKSMLELACGQAPHMPEIVNRGYRYTGIDLSEAMLEDAHCRTPQDAKVRLIRADMLDFSLERKVDFAFVLLGSLYATNSRELTSHFDSVARALRRGGLYFLDWYVEFEPLSEKNRDDTWVLERDGIRIKTNVSYEPLSLVEQTFEETITLEVDDHGRRLAVAEKSFRRAIYPQEFLRMLEARKDFEFVGWWNDWNLAYPLEAWPASCKISRPITLIRRT